MWAPVTPYFHSAVGLAVFPSFLSETQGGGKVLHLLQKLIKQIKLGPGGESREGGGYRKVAGAFVFSVLT